MNLFNRRCNYPHFMAHRSGPTAALDNAAAPDEGSVGHLSNALRRRARDNGQDFSTTDFFLFPPITHQSKHAGSNATSRGVARTAAVIVFQDGRPIRFQAVTSPSFRKFSPPKILPRKLARHASQCNRLIDKSKEKTKRDLLRQSHTMPPR